MRGPRRRYFWRLLELVELEPRATESGESEFPGADGFTEMVGRSGGVFTDQLLLPDEEMRFAEMLVLLAGRSLGGGLQKLLPGHLVGQIAADFRRPPCRRMFPGQRRFQQRPRLGRLTGPRLRQSLPGEQVRRLRTQLAGLHKIRKGRGEVLFAVQREPPFLVQRGILRTALD